MPTQLSSLAHRDPPYLLQHSALKAPVLSSVPQQIGYGNTGCWEITVQFLIPIKRGWRTGCDWLVVWEKTLVCILFGPFCFALVLVLFCFLFCFSFADLFYFLLSFYFHLLTEGTFKTTWSGKGKAYGEPCHISNPAYWKIKTWQLAANLSMLQGIYPIKVILSCISRLLSAWPQFLVQSIKVLLFALAPEPLQWVQHCCISNSEMLQLEFHFEDVDEAARSHHSSGLMFCPTCIKLWTV